MGTPRSDMRVLLTFPTVYYETLRRPSVELPRYQTFGVISTLRAAERSGDHAYPAIV